MNKDTQYDVTGLNPAEAAAAAGNDAVITDASATQAAVDEEPVEEPLEISTFPDDDMTFSQAFAAARQAMGPGAYFTWHGQVYGTYYRNEWDAMSPEQQTAFTSNAPAADQVQQAADEPQQSDMPIEVALDDTPDTDDSDIQVLGFDTIDTDDQSINLVTLGVNDQPVVFIDLDNDNVYDLAVADFDQSNSVLDSPLDIMPIHEYNITQGDVMELMNGQTHQVDQPIPDNTDLYAGTDVDDMPADIDTI